MTESPPTLPPLLAETSQLMRDRPSRIKLREIAAACSVSKEWLSQLQRDPVRMLHTSVGKLQTVNNWLKANRANA
jgi:hypothetical protein